MREIYHSDVITAAIASKYNKRDDFYYQLINLHMGIRYVTRKGLQGGNSLIEHIYDASYEDINANSGKRV
jgi:hypothetical protein